MSFALRYASHLGYAPPGFRPQFLATVGSARPAPHIRYARQTGFAGVFDPWAMGRSDADLGEIRNALTETGLSFSSIVCVPSDQLATPLWTHSSSSAKQRLERFVHQACEVATSLGSPVLAALLARDGEDADVARQIDQAVATLAAMGRIADDHGLKLGIEPMTVMPNMLVQSTVDAVELVRRADQRNVGVVFDTGHVSMMDGDLIRAFEEARELVVALQVADMPGRVEPGAGGLALTDLVVEAVRTGYDGLVDLEHQWLDPTPDGEHAGLGRIREFDRQVSAALQSVNHNSTDQDPIRQSAPRP